MAIQLTESELSTARKISFARPAKECVKCGQLLPRPEFGRAPRMATGVESYCRTCRNETNKRFKTPERRKEAARRFHQRHPNYRRENNWARNYGLRPEDYERQTRAQGGVCAICGGLSGRDYFDVDHEHLGSPRTVEEKRATLRGLLCNACNMGLGKFRDDPKLLRLAAEYLENGGVWQWPSS